MTTFVTLSVLLVIGGLAVIPTVVSLCCEFRADTTSGGRFRWTKSEWVSWIGGSAQPPRSRYRRTCDYRGVLKVTPPIWAKSVTFLMGFKKPTGWTFNIGDSITNNGYAGDAGTTREDAEVHSIGNNLRVYQSDIGNNVGEITNGAVQNYLMVRLSHHQLLTDNFQGVSSYRTGEGYFAFDTMYFGFNRVVQRANGAPSGRRFGEGLCSLCISFNYETTAQLRGKKVKLPKKVATEAVRMPWKKFATKAARMPERSSGQRAP